MSWREGRPQRRRWSAGESEAALFAFWVVHPSPCRVSEASRLLRGRYSSAR
jgi:hypothetical protein